MSDTNDTGLTPSGTSRFATTHWSVVLAAADSASPEHEQALSRLCQTYWFPLYAYLRRRGHDRHQAEDFTQAFFVQMLDKRRLSGVSPKPGKFRSFLLTALKNFVSDEYDLARAIKRGGTQKTISLNFQIAESQYTLEPTDELSPERLFERAWALTVLEQTMNRLEDEMTNTNKKELFDSLRVYVCGEPATATYGAVAVQLNMTENAVKVAVHRLRRRYRALLRNEIAQTVLTENQIDEEISHLFAAVAP
ncbi:MAG: sigma-70 family RNA polymerase sigma factor [Phycisphaerales bacterium]|nr:MAG: sigma-70 family RNA polymerase sigma factor [Phycisphaerales bacterium]